MLLTLAAEGVKGSVVGKRPRRGEVARRMGMSPFASLIGFRRLEGEGAYALSGGSWDGSSEGSAEAPSCTGGSEASWRDEELSRSVGSGSARCFLRTDRRRPNRVL